MVSYSIQYYLYRSNPILLRTILMPQTACIDDLLSAFCLGMGISPVPGEVHSEEALLPGAQPLSDFFTEIGFSGEAVIYPDAKKRFHCSLTFRFEYIEKVENGPESPTILEGSGSQLPPKVFQISSINQIQNQLLKRDSLEFEDLGLFYARNLAFSLKKTQKLLDTLFMPENVLLLHTELGVPMQTILENRSLPDLRDLCYYHRLNSNSQIRKAQLVSSLISELSARSASALFGIMDYPEYMRFKTLVTTGKTECTENADLPRTFPVMERFGRISITRKHTPQIHAPFLQHYEEWYDTDEEKKYLLKKKFTSVLLCCCFIHGVVTKPVLCAAYQALFPGETPSEELFEDILLHPRVYLNNTPYMFADKGWIAYDSSQFSAADLKYYLSILSEDPTERYLPTLADLNRYGQLNPWVDLPLFQPLKDVLARFTSFEENRVGYYAYIFRALHEGTSYVKILEQLYRYSYYYDRQRIKAEFQSILEQLDATLPKAIYYGYSREMAARKGLLTKVSQKIDLQKQYDRAEAARKKKAAAAAKKTTASRGRRNL